MAHGRLPEGFVEEEAQNETAVVEMPSMDFTAELHKMRRQIERLDVAFAHMQADLPTPLPPRRNSFAERERNLDEYQAPGKPRTATPIVAPGVGAERQSFAAFMHERRYDMTDKAERKEFARRVVGKDPV